jgi:hypothetical protein
MRTLILTAACLLGTTGLAPCLAENSVTFDARTAASGRWSDPGIWADRKPPRAGDRVQVRAGHEVTYDVESGKALRMVHVAGRLTFTRDRNTRLDVGLLRISPGDEASEDGFNCHESHDPAGTAPAGGMPTVEIGTPDDPIPRGIRALIRLVPFEGLDPESLPAIVNCGGRWEVHGAPMSRTWLKLGAAAKTGDVEVSLAEPVTGWNPGDRVIVTASRQAERRSTFRPGRNGSTAGHTEERLIVEVAGARLKLDRPLDHEHFGGGEVSSEVANLSRNVVIESAQPEGVRGHTLYHCNSAGGISYAEFRHLGKEGVLGRYAIHFHLVRDSMRGRGVIGASIWDSHNRWLTIHGTDHLLIRDCVGYRSVGHGFFLEDGTEQYNILDRNLAVQAYRGKRLPKQALPFDPNDGAGFWWANGRNVFIRNVACENDEYGFRFEIARRSDFDPVLNLRGPDGAVSPRDVRTVPFLRFEDNESHSEGLYSFNFGDDENPSVRGDRRHPFIARNLRAWETHYVLRPNVQFFLLEGLRVDHAAYGVYHPDYDAHVYRDVVLNRIDAEPINRGHDDESVQFGSFTYDRLTIRHSRIGRDPLIQMACTSPNADAAGHFRNVVLVDSESRQARVVDLGGGPRSDRLENPVAYFFHGFFGPRTVTKVVSAKFSNRFGDAFHQIDGFTGPDVLAEDGGPVPFPELLEPVDDLPPTTAITSVREDGAHVVVNGISCDDGEVATVIVSGVEARHLHSHAGVVDWTAALEKVPDDGIRAEATDAAGNRERNPVRWASVVR